MRVSTRSLGWGHTIIYPLSPIVFYSYQLYLGNVYFGGQPVCDDGWSFANAHVVCVSLGFAEADVPKKEMILAI